MPRTALWSVLSIVALSCSLDRDPNPHLTSGARAGGSDANTGILGPDGSTEAGAADAAPGMGKPLPVFDPGDADGSPGAAGSPAPSPCAQGCPEDAPVCLAPSGLCVQCARDSHCDDAALPVCDRERRACVGCTEHAHCGDDAPRCEPETLVCVQCLEHDDCEDPDAPRCDPDSRTCVRCLDSADCEGETPVCDADANACVQCLTHADCGDPALPQCADSNCGPCTGPSACKQREGATLCDTAPESSMLGACVECTVADETTCDGRVCDPRTQQCSSRHVASKGTCEDCIADSECLADHRCVPLQFLGEQRERSYCLKQVSSGCERPYASSPIERASVSGAAPDRYCGIDEQTTTCEAIAGLLYDAECEDGMDAECDAPGAICRTVNGVENRCTYACSLSVECPNGAMCSSGYCGGS